MRYRTLGRSGIRVSEVGFGCGNVGGMMVRGSHEEQVAAVRRALELGITYFDTAPGYGDGASETNLGRALAHLRPQVTVATKVRLSHEDLTDISGAVSRSIEASLRRLGRSCVDVLQLHTAVAQERGRGETLGVRDVLGNHGVADAFDAAKAQGLTRAAGFTGLGETEALHQVVESGRFDVVQTYYNLLNPSAGVGVPSGFSGQDFRLLIKRAAARGMGVVVIRALAAGALGGSEARRGLAAPSVGGAMAAGGEYSADEARARALRFLVPQHASSTAEAAVRFALGNPDVSAVLVGFSSLRQIEEAAACSSQGALPDAAKARLQELWASDFGGH